MNFSEEGGAVVGVINYDILDFIIILFGLFFALKLTIFSLDIMMEERRGKLPLNIENFCH